MEQTDQRVARATWSQKLVTYYFVDVDMLATAIHGALPKTARDAHRTKDIAALLTSDLALFPERAAGWYRTDGDKEFLGVHIFVRRYSKWMKLLGASLGFQVESMLIEDEWVDDPRYTELQAVIWGLMDRVRADLKAAREITSPEAIEAAFNTVRRSVSAGEPPHQTHVRASRITRGLRLIS
ncbi:hypothetical protein H8F21_13530 [Pseudomonas sp. P66]|uniref:Uncharacterized protein n=1 Tax=Pseudomonas arcuscaelestis TaxID=2710591 RepID=A0ABS2BYR1_9PSED|nr:hypothetical protein [Pseudomonas arcuscaelestis]MBM5458585.1 hypothetical protein [Pseudomonas arcuscaelestis]